ncbi:histidine phosphatase family protein [Marinobacter sp. M3C]|uniref:histidine phosphatase family protein n=1 Tax=unclassified Marinobacter TaxID=83889 RepID=UPI002010B76C|nr:MULTISPECIES: histidine phosphatase family protein [unclassified Marinobacter]MCL1477328.1 histidine phosphatase family protein [Marinobacter sp.]MCL1482545.1 histidine phosphatase family protein [Marinobacter sp.]MCL1488326.1 histidine phosphatase family protein [Marinobacter sp.]UQG57028.1 histidine phosphatase family protein [Marinobacter sp. M4C]UQG61776.1 histidine phosphatase family protein [Marinobacter sp. M3C]
MTQLIRCLLVTAMLALTSGPAAAGATPDENAAWQALKEGKALLVLRHALAPGFGDPESFQLEDCSTQRNLNAEGRRQARAWKPFLAARGINEARVFSSQWCRCLDTANGMDTGSVTEWPSLNSFFLGRGDGRLQTQQTVKQVNEMPPGKPVIMVSHQVNITALADVYPSSNEGVIISLPLSENPKVLARVSPSD